MLEIISMKTNFWFAALSPFVNAVVAFATAAELEQAFGTFVR